jgi:hypothetical protein
MLRESQLSPAERRLQACAASGSLADLRTGVTERDDVTDAQGWAEERNIRAEVITDLLLSAAPPERSTLPTLRLAGARITGRMDVAGADVSRALWLEGCYLGEEPEFSDARTRSVRITRCALPGLSAFRIRAEGQFDLSDSLVNERVSLVNAHITGELIFSGARIANPGRWSIFAGGMTVDGALFARHGFTSEGSIRLVGAQLHGGLYLDTAKLNGTGRNALVADNLSVDGRMVCERATVEGAIRMPGAHINGQLSLDGAVVRASGVVLDFRRITADELLLTLREPTDGIVDLGYAQISVLCDDPATWPAGLRLDGLRYDSLVTLRERRAPATPGGGTGATPDLADITSAEILPAEDRLAWLRRGGSGYRPQPYEQLAAFYRQVGHDDQARKVLLAKQRARRSTEKLAGKIWGYLLDWSVGYGYRPWLAALWLVALITLGSVVFGLNPPAPVTHSSPAHFNPLFYTIDLLFPFGQFGQSNSMWVLSTPEQWFAYSLVGAGWLLATAVIAGVSRALSRS